MEHKVVHDKAAHAIVVKALYELSIEKSMERVARLILITRNRRFLNRFREIIEQKIPGIILLLLVVALIAVHLNSPKSNKQ